MNRRNALRLLGTVLLAPAGAKILFAAASEAEAKASFNELMQEYYLHGITKPDAFRQLEGITESTYPQWAGRQNGKTELNGAQLEWIVQRMS